MYGIEIIGGEIWINGKRLLFPRDASFSPASMIFGLDSSGTPIPLAISDSGAIKSTPGAPTPLTDETTQNLASGPLLYTTALTSAFKINAILFHVNVAVTETLTITLNTQEGYDIVLSSAGLSSGQDAVWTPDNISQYFMNGDQLTIECTNNDATGTIDASIRYEI